MLVDRATVLHIEIPRNPKNGDTVFETRSVEEYLKARVGPFDPIGHSRPAKLAAAAAAHARAEGWHRGTIRPVVHIDRALVAAVLAGREQTTPWRRMPPCVIRRIGSSSLTIRRTDRERYQVTGAREPP